MMVLLYHRQIHCTSKKLAFRVKTFVRRINKAASRVYHKLTQNERLEVNEMAHIDVPKVRGKMAEKGITLTRLAELLGINVFWFRAYPVRAA